MLPFKRILLSFPGKGYSRSISIFSPHDLCSKPHELLLEIGLPTMPIDRSDCIPSMEDEFQKKNYIIFQLQSTNNDGPNDIISSIPLKVPFNRAIDFKSNNVPANLSKLNREERWTPRISASEAIEEKIQCWNQPVEGGRPSNKQLADTIACEILRRWLRVGIGLGGADTHWARVPGMSPIQLTWAPL